MVSDLAKTQSHENYEVIHFIWKRKNKKTMTSVYQMYNGVFCFPQRDNNISVQKVHFKQASVFQKTRGHKKKIQKVKVQSKNGFILSKFGY